jgi:excisionase family DNA binding protein
VANMIASKYLTVAELSEYLQIHRTTIYRMLRQGKLPGFRIGSDWRFSLEAIEEWQRAQTKIDAGSQIT